MIVADTSVAAKWLFPEEILADLAVRLLDHEFAGTGQIVAPPLLGGEVTSILRQRMRRESLPLETAVLLLDRFIELPITIVPPPGIEQYVLRVAAEFDLSATYDAHYAVLARMIGCELWTDDRPLLRALPGHLPFVRWIGDYGQ